MRYCLDRFSTLIAMSVIFLFCHELHEFSRILFYLSRLMEATFVKLGRAPTLCRLLSRGAEVPGYWDARVLGNREAMSNYLLANSFTT